jgi:hypothetical protein
MLESNPRSITSNLRKSYVFGQNFLTSWDMMYYASVFGHTRLITRRISADLIQDHYDACMNFHVGHRDSLETCWTEYVKGGHSLFDSERSMQSGNRQAREAKRRSLHGAFKPCNPHDRPPPEESASASAEGGAGG